MNISMVLIGGGLLIGAMAFLPKGDEETEEGREVLEPTYVEGVEQAEVYDPDTGYYHELDVIEFIPFDDYPPDAPSDTGIPMGEPERRLTTSGNVEISVEAR
jgi:hypothetical protein